MQRCLLTSPIAPSVKNLPAMLESLVRFLGREDVLRSDRLPTPVLWGFPGGSAGKESTCNVGDLGSIPGLGKSPGEGKSYPLQDSGLENSMGTIVHGVTKSRTQLSNFHFRIIQQTDPHQLLKDLPCRPKTNSCFTSLYTSLIAPSSQGKRVAARWEAAAILMLSAEQAGEWALAQKASARISAGPGWQVSEVILALPGWF